MNPSPYMRIAHLSLVAVALGAATFAARADRIDVGISIGGPEVVVKTSPPPLRAEVVEPMPGPGFIWIRGHWAWHHERWEWIGGHWDRAAQPGSVWVPGAWIERHGGWVWVEGHFIVQAPPPPPGPGREVEVVASEEPPAPIMETVPVSPGPEYFWVAGHWHWNGGWVWVRGGYQRHPHYHPGAYWEPGRWTLRAGTWVWHDGHWR